MLDTLQRVVVVWTSHIGLVVMLRSILAVSICVEIIGKNFVPGVS
jgi:hypothetical protein